MIRVVAFALAFLFAGCGGGSKNSPGDTASAGNPVSKWSHFARFEPPKDTRPLAAPAVTGTLGRSSPAFAADGSRYEVWQFRGNQGDLVRLRMESEALDPYLALLREGDAGTEVFAVDDDSGGGKAAEIACELPASGTYWAVATSALRKQEGAYRLHFETEGLPAFPAADPKDRYALLVGVGDYPRSEFDLPADSTDLALMQDVLTSRFGFRKENVVTLRNLEATRTRVMHAFREHLGRAGDGGLALFYFTGHGLKTNEDAVIKGELLDPDDEDGDEALLLADGSFLYDDEVGYLADRIDGARVVLVLDCCYAGSASRGGQKGWTKGISHNDARPFLKSAGRETETIRDPGRQLLLAAALPGQEARVVPDLEGRGPASPFTAHLVLALREAGPEATFLSLMQEVSTTTAAFVEDALDVPQNPMIAGRWQEERIVDMLGAP